MDGCKIIRAVKPVGIITTAGQHRVGNTVAYQISQLDSQVHIRQFCQKTVGSNLMYFFKITFQRCINYTGANLLHLLHKRGCTVGWWAIAVAEMFQHSRFMGWGHEPEAGNCDRLCSGSGVGIRDIKNITPSKLWTAVIQQRNTTGTAVDPSAHAPVPDIHGCAGCGVWPLSMDEDLIFKWIFIYPGGSFQKLLPAATHRGKLRDFLAAKLCN